MPYLGDGTKSNSSNFRLLDDISNQFDGNKWWDLRSANNQEVAPGLYIYHVESNNGEEKIGKFAVVR